MTMFPENHPACQRLADEVPACPPPALRPSGRSHHLAVLVDAKVCALKGAHVGSQVRSLGPIVVGPGACGSHCLRAHRRPASFGWERRGEFYGHLAIPGGAMGAAALVDIEIRRRPGDPAASGDLTWALRRQRHRPPGSDAVDH